MKNVFFILLSFVLLLFSGCEKDSVETISSITFPSGKVPAPVLYDLDESVEIKFNSTDDWSATTSTDWLLIEPAKGNAGDGSITITTTETQENRTGTVILSSGNAKQEISVTQVVGKSFGEFTNAIIVDRKDIYGTGQYNWDIILTTDGVESDIEGVISGDGQATQIWLVTPLGTTDPTGTYTIDNSNANNTATAGTLFGETALIGSWWIDQEATLSYRGTIPFTFGTVEVTKDGDNYNVLVEALDNVSPEANIITVTYDGPATILDPLDTGDFFDASATYYGTFQYDSPYQNWFLGMSNEEYSVTFGEKGYSIVFDMLASEESIFTKLLPEGVFTIDTEFSLDLNTIPEARVDIYSNYEVSESIGITSGTITISNLDETKSEIIVNVTTADGAIYEGVYTGPVSLYNEAYPPMQDRVFNGEGASVIGGYLGGDSFSGKSNWFLEMRDSEFITTNTDGFAVFLDFVVDADHTFDKGFPVGTFELFEPVDFTNQNGLINSDHTLYCVYYQTNEMKYAFTNGSVTISNPSDDVYTVELNLATENEVVSYSITGGYEGFLDLEDITNGARSDDRLSKVQTLNYKVGQFRSQIGN